MAGHAEQEQDLEHENDGVAQVRHHIGKIAQPSFGNKVIRDEVESEQYDQPDTGEDLPDSGRSWFWFLCKRILHPSPSKDLQGCHRQ